MEIENLVLSEKDSSSKAFLTIGRFAFLYSLPSLLIGSIHIEEIGVESVKLVIQKKNMKYNFESIFPNKQKVEEEIVNKKNSDSIYTGIYIKFTSLFQIKNLSISYEDEEKKFSLEDLSLQFFLETKRWNTLYFDQRSLDVIKNFSLILQPSEYIQTEFQSQTLYFKDKIGFHLLIQAKGDELLEWSQSLIFELKEITPMISNQVQTPLNLQFSFQTELSQSKLQVKQILLVFQNLQFLEGNGIIENIFDLKSNIQFRLTNSNIDLDVLNKSLAPYKLPIPNLSGNLKLSPLDIHGNLEDFKLNWSPEISKVNIKMDQKNHSLSSGMIQTDIQMGIKEIGTEKKVIIENATLIINSMRYNTMLLTTQIQLKKKILSGSINVLEMNLNQFDKSIQGILDLKVNIEDSSLSNIYLSMKSEIKNFQVPIDSYNLKPSNLKLQSKLNILLDDSFQLLNVDLLGSNIDLISYRSGTTLVIDSEKITFDKIKNKLYFNNLILKLYPEKMVSLLPYTLGETLLSASPLLGNEVTLKSNLEYELDNQKQMKGILESKIPGIQLNDLKTKIHLELDSDGRETIHINEIQMNGYEMRLNTSLNGDIYQKKSKSPDLNFSFRFQSDTKKNILSGVEFKGKLESQIKFQESNIYGTFSSENSHLYFQKGECPGKDCKFINVNNLNCSIPILHEAKSKINVSILDGNKETLIQTKGMERGNNLFIESISTSHPIYPETSFAMIQGNSKSFGITARVDYISNLFSLSNLTVKTLNGSIGSKNIQINVADGDPKHFEFLGNLQIRDIDLTELIPKENKIGIDDGKIRGDINFSGKNLKDIIDNTDIYFSVYKIGKDFGKSAINIVSPPNLIRDYIVSSYSVDRIETELSKGLIYVNILFKPSLLSNLLTKIENNKISMERMPLNNFMNRAENEISKYK